MRQFNPRGAASRPAPLRWRDGRLLANGTIRGFSSSKAPPPTGERLRRWPVGKIPFLLALSPPLGVASFRRGWFRRNRAENDIRMLKVQQKISGCFRSKTGADDFCLLRSYLLTCERNGMGPHEALTILFTEQLPIFLSASLLDMSEEQKAA